ncbi:MAG: hypothetical protein AAFQ88_07625 [Pseudomonadota bacterium]
MGRAAALSAAGHGLFLLAMLIGGAFTQAEAPELPTMGQVTLITEADFQAAVATAPQTAESVADGLSEAGGEAESVPASEAAEATPDVPAVAPAAAPVPSEPVRPTIAEVPSPDILANQAPVPESPAATEPVQPLASTAETLLDSAPVAPERPEPAPEAEAVETPPQEEPEPTETAEDPASGEGEPSRAPQTAALPVARPAGVAAAAPASGPSDPAPQPEPEPETTETAEAPTPEREPAAESESPAPAAQAPTFAQQVTRGERDALSLGIREFFSYGGNRSDRSLAVTVSIRLDRSGKIVEGPEMVRAQGGNPAVQRALFQSARRALLMAQRAGVFGRLPAQKYEAWRWMHVTFTPETNATGVGFS